MPAPPPAPAPPPRRMTIKLPVWALPLLALGMLALFGVQLAWTLHEHHGWPWWSAGLVGAAGSLLLGIAMGVLVLLVQQQLVLEYQKGTFEITIKQVEALSRLLGGRGDDAKGWAKRHRLDRQVHRRRPRGDVEP